MMVNGEVAEIYIRGTSVLHIIRNYIHLNQDSEWFRSEFMKASGITIFRYLLIFAEPLLYRSRFLPPCQKIYNQSQSIKCTKSFKTTSKIVWFEVFTAVTMKNVVFRDVAPCRSYVNRRFGGTYHLHLQGRKICERWISVSRWLQNSS
jgi:hypothetical protein